MIVGGGKISFYLARLLCESGLQVKILEKDKERCDLLSELLPRAMVICGDGSDQSLLMEEDLDRADALVALTNMDEENVIISMFATLREVGKVIAKINHISLDQILEKSGVDCTVTPHLISSNQIVQYVRAMQNSRGSGVESIYLASKENKGEWVIDEEAAAVVRRIFHSVVAGECIASIARALRAEKIPQLPVA